MDAADSRSREPPILKNQWYIGCSSIRLGSRPLAVRIGDEDVVLFRDSGGAPAALLDRCCHRGVKLSRGKVTDGALACGYHGWRFDGAGQCVHIPSLVARSQTLKRYQIPAFPCVEQDGYVWVWVGETLRSLPEPVHIPKFQERRWLQGSVSMRCAWLKGVENNVDWCHPHFAHPWSKGQFFATLFGRLSEQTYEVRLEERGLAVSTPTTDGGDQPIPVDPSVRLTYHIPDRVMVEVGRVIIVMHFVPTGPSSCRQEWMMSRLGLWGPRVAWSEREPKILRQDRLLLESAQPAYDKGGAAFERNVEADASTLIVRQIVTLAERGQWDTGRSRLPQRRLVRVRA